MRNVALAALLLTFVAAPRAADDDVRYSDSLERAFAPAGIVRLDLSAGDYRIRRGDDERIRVTWYTRSAERLNQVWVKATVKDKTAAISTSGVRGRARFEIELPRRSDLHLRMTAGDLSIAGIEGNKDVFLRAGDLDIEVPEPDQYRQVRASLVAGDLTARPFGFTTGGLFRSFDHSGPGRYNLRVRLWAGDLRLVAPRSARAEQ